MADLQDLQRWIEGYIRAWNSNAPEEIGALFAADAVYYTAPFREPWRGRQAIVESWLGRKDEPGQTRFTWQPVTVTEEVSIIQGVTEYLTQPPQTFSNLWVIRLDSYGRCTSFTEWWMDQSGGSST